MKSIIQENKECWRDIKGYEGLYQVSNFGRVKSLSRYIGHRYANKKRLIPEKIMTNCNNGKGYECVYLVKYKKRKIKYIHRLVAEAFIQNPEHKTYVNHLDYNIHNNTVKNLEWCTQLENVQWSIINMHHRKNSKTNTGEKYITRRNNGMYRIIIDKKEYPSQKCLLDAVLLRNKILKEKGVVL